MLLIDSVFLKYHAKTLIHFITLILFNSFMTEVQPYRNQQTCFCMIVTSVTKDLIRFRPMFPFSSTWKQTRSKVFWCFLGEWNRIIGQIGINWFFQASDFLKEAFRNCSEKWPFQKCFLKSRGNNEQHRKLMFLPNKKNSI